MREKSLIVHGDGEQTRDFCFIENTVGANLLAATVVSVALGLILIPRFGIEGAAIAELVTMVLWNGGALAYIKAKFGRTPGYLPLLKQS